MYFGDPLICPPPGLARFAWVTTDTVERAQQVCDLLQGEHEFTMNELKEEKGRMRLNVDLQAPLRRNSFLPFIANKPENVTSPTSSSSAARWSTTGWCRRPSSTRWRRSRLQMT